MIILYFNTILVPIPNSTFVAYLCARASMREQEGNIWEGEGESARTTLTVSILMRLSSVLHKNRTKSVRFGGGGRKLFLLGRFFMLMANTHAQHGLCASGARTHK